MSKKSKANILPRDSCFQLGRVTTVVVEVWDHYLPWLPTLEAAQLWESLCPSGNIESQAHVGKPDSIRCNPTARESDQLASLARSPAVSRNALLPLLALES